MYNKIDIIEALVRLLDVVMHLVSRFTGSEARRQLMEENEYLYSALASERSYSQSLEMKLEELAEFIENHLAAEEESPESEDSSND